MFYSSTSLAYMKPEQVSNVIISQEEYNVSSYYDEVNRTKYTAERKRELSALLGSTSRCSSDTKSTTVSYNSSNDSKGSDAPTFNLEGLGAPGTSGTDGGTTASVVDPKVSKIIGASGSVKDIDRGGCVVDTKTPSSSTLSDSQYECMNGRAASISMEVDPQTNIAEDLEISIVPTIRTPLTKPCAQFSYIMDDSSLMSGSVPNDHKQKDLLTSSSKPKKHSSSNKRLKCHNIDKLRLHTDNKHMCNGQQPNRRRYSSSDWDSESDLLIERRVSETCPVLVHRPQETKSDCEDNESSCSSKMLSSSPSIA